MNSIFNQWINSGLISKNDKLIMKKYSSAEVNEFFSNNKLCFGTAGIRGTMGPGTRQMNQFV